MKTKLERRRAEELSAGILLVDDNSDYTLLVEEALSEACPGRRLLVASTAEAAHELLEGTRPHPLFALVDLNLPGTSGLEVIRSIKTNETWGWIPTHAFSGSDCVRDMRAAYQAGTNAYLLKPTTYDELVELLRHVENLWSRIARLPGQTGATPFPDRRCPTSTRPEEVGKLRPPVASEGRRSSSTGS